MNMGTISWDDFENVDLPAGTITAAESFPEACKPAWKLTMDFGPDLGSRRSYAQITAHYRLTDFVGRQVLCVGNFPPKRIDPFMSECLDCGFYRDYGSVNLAVPDRSMPDCTGLS